MLLYMIGLWIGHSPSVMMLTDTLPFLGPLRTILTVMSGIHFSLLLIFLQFNYFKIHND